ncbi:MAG: alpha/beta fold hydrolase [Rhodospirillales bacterium]|nr:MAG: alpha/beta fold hydrolase [Rhodospirillales bacterium]
MLLHFLPGVSGGAFWEPVAARLPSTWPREFVDWPGMAGLPPVPGIDSFDDLVRMMAARLAPGSVLIAQSMGGVVAARLALAHPDKVAALVLTATSGGIDMAPYDAEDWRPEYRTEHPDAAEWIYERGPDHSEALATLAVPTLLIWATRDAISPLGVGRRLAALLPRAELVEIDSDDHWVARQHPDIVAPAIERHIRRHAGV